MEKKKKEKKELNYEQDVRIDETALDVEWLRQATLTFKYTKNQAFCSQQYDDEKASLDLVYAGLQLRVRMNPEKYKIEKPTNDMVEAVVKKSIKYQEALKKLNVAKYNLEVAQAALNGIYAKKSALENLVRLFGQQYFAGPTTPRILDKEWLKKQEEINRDKKVSDNLKQK